ncbi:MAG: hypothetical protein ACRDSG_15225 [Pseudonocardiaceae bacterium]
MPHGRGSGIKVNFAVSSGDPQGRRGLLRQAAFGATGPNAEDAVGGGNDQSEFVLAGGDGVQAFPYRPQPLVDSVGPELVPNATALGCPAQEAFEAGDALLAVEVTGIDEVGDRPCVGLSVDLDMLGGGVVQGVENDGRRQVECVGGAGSEGEDGEHGDDGADMRGTVELRGGRDSQPLLSPRGCADEISIGVGDVGDSDRREDQLIGSRYRGGVHGGVSFRRKSRQR